jgi:predicted TPR repeat methyltransferase
MRAAHTTRPAMSVPEALHTAVGRGLAYALEARLAVHYERHLVQECRYRTHEVLANELAALEPPRGVFVDMGAGTGLVGEAISARNLPLELVAVDISTAMLQLIDSPSYVAKHVADCAVTPLGDASFDGALAAGLLEHIIDPSALFLEVARIVKPGGLFLFSFAPNHAGTAELFDAEQGLVSHDSERIRKSLGEAGLRVTKEVDYPAYLNGSKSLVTQRMVIACCSA